MNFAGDVEEIEAEGETEEVGGEWEVGSGGVGVGSFDTRCSLSSGTSGIDGFDGVV